MAEYSFESIPITRRRAGNDFAHDYREVIQERAAEGWDFVQAIPLEQHEDPRIDLVFVRKGVSQ